MALICAFLMCFMASAFSKESPRVMGPFYGEKDFTQFAGPGQFDFYVDQGLGKVKFLEETINKERLFSLFGGLELLDVESTLEDLYVGDLCPNEELSAHQDYLQYLFRLVSISYLEEHIHELRAHAKKLRLGDVCSKSLEESLRSCRPKGPDMSLFLKSAKVLSKNFDEPSISYNFPFDDYLKTWLKGVRGDDDDTIVRRYRLYCQQNKCPKKPSRNFLKKAFGSICEEDLNSFQKICSEEDRLYGRSRSAQFYRAIIRSEALKVINGNENGPGCLIRYASLMSSREEVAQNVTLIGRSMYEEKRKNGPLSELTGRLFPAGSLKRFAQAGLDTIFVEEPIKKALEREGKEKFPEVTLAPLAPAPIKQIFKKPKKRAALAPAPKRPEEPKKSHFLETSLTRKTLGLESAKIDMLKLRYDYVFNSKMLGYLAKEMGRFATRKGLEEMKAFDGLGSPKGPVPLLFIKYLIEEKKYQELFNLTDVVGSEFFVLNNIDDNKLREKNNYVRLEFDKSSPFQWQLYVLAAPVSSSTNQRE